MNDESKRHLVGQASLHDLVLAEKYRQTLEEERAYKNWVDSIIEKIGSLISTYGETHFRHMVSQWDIEQKARKSAGKHSLQLFVMPDDRPPVTLCEKYACLAAFYDLHVETQKISPVLFRYIPRDLSREEAEAGIANGKISLHECVVLHFSTYDRKPLCPCCKKPDIERMVADVKAASKANATSDERGNEKDKGNGKGKPGRPKLTKKKRESYKRYIKKWKMGQHNTYSDCAASFGERVTKDDIRNALDYNRKCPGVLIRKRKRPAG